MSEAPRRALVTRRPSPALAIFVLTRAGIWAAAAFAFAWFPRHGGGFGYTLWVRTDSNWYTSIARHWYGADPLHTPAFFPFYPALIAGLGRLIDNYDLAGLLISLVCCAVSFELLWRFAKPRLGPSGASRTVVYLALFPAAIYLQAVYTESLFLMLALAAFALAERDHWFLAAVTAGLAMLTRSIGVAVLATLFVMAWPRIQRLGWLLVSLVIFSAFPLLLHFEIHSTWAFVHAQRQWDRSFSLAGPFGGLWVGIKALWGRGTGNFSEHFYLAMNIMNLVYVALFLALIPLVWRRVGRAYALYALLTVAIPLSVPGSSGDFPLLSMPRFTMLAFPCFAALASLGSRANTHTAIVAASATILGIAIMQWTLGMPP
ncbi:MAG TPA: glycosyltransferase family 39 protein [Gaiellaceae bacterium]